MAGMAVYCGTPIPVVPGGPGLSDFVTLFMLIGVWGLGQVAVVGSAKYTDLVTCQPVLCLRSGFGSA